MLQSGLRRLFIVLFIVAQRKKKCKCYYRYIIEEGVINSCASNVCRILNATSASYDLMMAIECYNTNIEIFEFQVVIS